MNNYNDHGAAEAAKDAEIARLRDEIEELRERMREAAKLNMGLMGIRRDNEAEIERLRELLREFLADGEDLVVGIHDDWLRRVREALGE